MIEVIFDANDFHKIDKLGCNYAKLLIIWVLESEFEHSDLMPFEVSRQKKLI